MKRNLLLTSALAAMLAAPMAIAAGGSAGASAGSGYVTFQDFDMNNDGVISRSEFNALASGAGSAAVGATGTGRPAGGAVIPGTAGRETEGGVDNMPEDRVGGELVGPGNLRPGKDEGDYTPQGQLGGDPLRSPPAASGSAGAGGAGL